jgi:hypothetical protein
MKIEVPAPHATLELVMGDGASRSGALSPISSKSWPCDFRNHGQNPPAASGRDGHTYDRSAAPRAAPGAFHEVERGRSVHAAGKDAVTINL